MAETQAQSVGIRMLVLPPSPNGGKASVSEDEIWRGVCRGSAQRLKAISSRFVAATGDNDSTATLNAVHLDIADDTGQDQHNAGQVFEQVLHSAISRNQLTAPEKDGFTALQTHFNVVNRLLERSQSINIDTHNMTDAQVMQQNIKQYVATVNEAVGAANQIHTIVFNFSTTPSALSGLPAQASLLSAIENSLKVSSKILTSLNAISNLQKQLTNLAEDVVSLTTEFESKMVTVFQSLSSQAQSLNDITVQDMPLVTQETNAQTMLSGASGYNNWVHSGSPASIYLPPSSSGTQANADYWQNAGIGSPVGFYYFAQSFAAVDISDSNTIPPTALQPTNTVGTGAGSIVEQYSSNTAQTGVNVAFIVTQQGMNYTGSGTNNGGINNSISIPSALFSLMPSNSVSPDLVTADVTSNPLGISYNRSTLGTNQQIAYLNTAALLNVCSTVMTLAGAFLQTEGYIGVFSSALGPTATYTTLSGAINVIGNITQAVSNAPDQAQQNAQTIGSSVTSLLSNFTTQILPNFRFSF